MISIVIWVSKNVANELCALLATIQDEIELTLGYEILVKKEGIRHEWHLGDDIRVSTQMDESESIENPVGTSVECIITMDNTRIFEGSLNDAAPILKDLIKKEFEDEDDGYIFSGGSVIIN